MSNRFQAAQSVAADSTLPVDWFLVEVQAAMNPPYVIINSLDIIEAWSNTQIKFKYGELTLTGVVECSSTDICLIDAEYSKKLCKESCWYLLRYSVGAKNVVHTVVRLSNVSSISVNEKGQNEVYITHCNEQQVATVLYKSSDKNETLEKLQTLTAFCLEATFSSSPNDMNLKTCAWFLVQYNCIENNIVFAIVNQDETAYLSDNNYRREYVFIRSGTNDYAARVLSQSNSFSELVWKINMIKEISLDLPLEPESNTITQKMDTDNSEQDFELGAIGCHVVKKKCKVLKMKKQQESEEISHAFRAVNLVRDVMKRQLSIHEKRLLRMFKNNN